MKKAILLICLLIPATILAETPVNPEFVLYPLDRLTVVGGNVTLSTKFYVNETNGERNATNIPINYIKVTMGKDTLYETDKAPFYFKRDFTSYKSGLYTVITTARGTNGLTYTVTNSITISNINAIFRVTLTTALPEGRHLYVSGSTAALGPIGEEWDPRGMKMTRKSPTNYEAVFPVGCNESVTYEFTLGGWALKGKDKLGNYIHRITKITNNNQVVETLIDNFGKVTGSVKRSGYFISYENGLTNIRIAYTHSSNSAVTLSYSYDGSRFSDIQSGPSQFSAFYIPALQGSNLYFVFSDNAAVTNTFAVPRPSLPFDCVFFSDIHLNGGALFKQIVSNEKPSFILSGGDLLLNGNQATDWDAVLLQYKTINTRYFFQSTIGNHEEETPLYDSITGLPHFYSYSYANSYFISIDNNIQFEPGSKTYAWLEGELKKAAKFDFRFVYMHIPPYSNLKHGEDKFSLKYLVPLFEKYGVKAVFSGHEHGYQVSFPIRGGKRNDKNGIVYFISGGGGGGQLYNLVDSGDWMRMHKQTHNYIRIHVENTKAVITVIDPKNTVIDQVEFAR